MTPSILYSFRRCPYAMRARMALAYSKQPLEIREITLKKKPSSMLHYSPKGTVPILILMSSNRDVRVIDESLDIMLWALEQNDPDGWWPENLTQQDEIKQLIKFCDNTFKTHLDRYKYADRYPEQSAAHYRQMGEEFLSRLDQRLSKTTYLCSHHLSLADMAIFPFIRQFAHVDKTWFEKSAYKYLQAWLDQHLKSEIFIAVMKKYAPWQDVDQTILFP